MDSSNYEIIQAMYDELKKEQTSLLSDLHEKKSNISEIDAYLNGLLNKEESNFQVFLPRKVKDIYRDIIEKSEQEKEKLFAECEELEKQLHLDNNRIKQLEKILSDTSMLHVKYFSILDAQEKERQRIARDLHDTSLQTLTHLVHKVELSSIYVDEDPVKAKLELLTIEKGIRKVIEEIRDSIFNLRPLPIDGLSLRETIEKLITVLNQDRQFHIESDIDEFTVTQSDSSTYVLFISIYRLVQECMQNAIKHSGGNKIIVNLKDYGASYRIHVQDNGTGFDVKAALKKDKHFGLSVIKERVLFLGGKLNIDAQHGTSIEIEIPKVYFSTSQM